MARTIINCSARLDKDFATNDLSELKTWLEEKAKAYNLAFLLAHLDASVSS